MLSALKHACVVMKLLADVRVEDITKIFVEVFAIDTRAGVAIDTVSSVDSVSDVGVELLIGAIVAAMTAL